MGGLFSGGAPSPASGSPANLLELLHGLAGGGRWRDLLMCKRSSSGRRKRLAGGSKLRRGRGSDDRGVAIGQPML